MANSMRVRFLGQGEIDKTLSSLSLKGQAKATARIGFNTPYAARIHEDMEMFHRNGQAKFLEVAYRNNMVQARDIIKVNLVAKRGLIDALRKAGHHILRKAKELVPVDTGRLRDSGYVEVR